MQQQRKKVWSETPKIDQLMATMSYFSPTKLINESEMILTIRTIAQETFQEQSTKDFQEDNNQLSNKSLNTQKLNYVTQRKKKQLQQKNKNAKLINIISSKNIPPQTQNLYDKYGNKKIQKQQHHLTKNIQKIFQRQKIYTNQLPFKKSQKYNNTKSKLYQPQNKTLNYQKYLKNNIIGQDKQKVLISSRNNNLTSYHNHSINKSKKQINLGFQNVLKKSKQLEMRKLNSAKKIIEQNIRLQTQQLTLTPLLISKQLRSDISLSQRKKIIQGRNQSKKKQLTKEIFQQYSFTPKLNKNEFVQSKVKKTWKQESSGNLKLEKNSFLKQRSSAIKKDKSFNTTMQLPIKDIKEITFLLD